MKITNILSRGNWVFAHKNLVKKYGSDAAIIIGFLSEQQDQFEDWFYCTYEKIEEILGIKQRSIPKVIKMLISEGILETKREGLPCKTYYLINEEVLCLAIEKEGTLVPPKLVGQDIPKLVGHYIKKDYKERKTIKRIKRKVNITIDQFEEFYKVYPRKVNKGAAKKSFIRLTKLPVKEQPTIQILIKAIIAQSNQEQWKDPKYIPHPSTWLNNNRWEDEILISKQTGNGSRNYTEQKHEYSEGVEFNND